MVQKRSRFQPGFQSRFLPAKKPVPIVSTRSTVRATTLGSPYFRRSVDDDVLYTPYRPSVIPHYSYDSTANEYSTHSDISRELIMSSAAMEDNYDITNRSRQRDRDVLAAANRAITTSVDSPTRIEPSNLSTTTTTSGYKSRRSESSRRSQAPRSHSVPPKRPTYTPQTTTDIIPYDLKASAPPKPSPYLNYSKHLDTTNALRASGSYEPLYSNFVRTDYSPMRDVSPYRQDSPFRSESPYRESSPPLETTSRLVKKRLKPPRVLANKRRVGNYYDRLLSKRAKGGKSCKYWPYIDVEDIENENLGDVLSDTEPDHNVSADSGYYGYPGYTGYGGSEYVIAGGDGTEGSTSEVIPLPLNYSSNYEPLPYSSASSYEPLTYSSSYEPLTYSSSYEPESDIPDEYVPFRPKPRTISPERDYSEMSIIPYMPARDPNKNTAADDISFNAVVAASAARARRALENVNWNDYDSAGLVLSVEGEYQPTEEDTPLGFRYVSRPIMLKVPASQRVRVSDSDNAFTKYMTDLQRFREGIRARLEDGYKALSRETVSCVAPTLPALTSSSSYTSSYYRPISRSYRTRLTDEAGYKHGHSLELYPLSSESRTRSLTSSDDNVPPSGALKIYDFNTDKYSRLGTLARVEIKVDTEVHSTPRGAVAALRVTRGHSTPPPATKFSRTEVHVATARASPNNLRYSVPPAYYEPTMPRRPRYPRVTVRPRYRYWFPARAATNYKYTAKYSAKQAREPSPEFEGLRRAPLSLLAYLRNLESRLETGRYRTRSVPVRGTYYKKAALLANKVEVNLPERKGRRPKSSYAQAKMRHLNLHKDKHMDDGEFETTATTSVDTTSGLKAHAPVHENTCAKPYWDAEGVKKPNIMSWKYRLDTYANPDDLIIAPRSLGQVRSQLKDAHEKLDRHRQLMDRYLLSDQGLTVEDNIVLMKLKSQTGSSSEPASFKEAKQSDWMKKTRQKN